MRNKLFIGCLLSIAIVSQSCMPKGAIVFASTSALDSLNRGKIGLVEQAKASPDVKTAFFENEDIRAVQPTWAEQKLDQIKNYFTGANRMGDKRPVDAPRDGK